MANDGLYDKVVSGQAWAEFCDALPDVRVIAI